MVRKGEFLGILVLAVIFLTLLAFNQRDEENRYHRAIRYDTEFEDDPEEQGLINASLATIKDVIELQKESIRKSLWDYHFPPTKNLHNYSLKTGGRPIRTVIVTTWRSGSTFLGDVINAVPGNFYHYEPLLDYGIVQIRGPPYSDSAISNLKNLLNCDYTNLQAYLDYGKAHTFLFTHNTRLWSVCDAFPQYCWNSTFLSNFCKLFPFQSVKTVRLRLKLAEALLRDEQMNVKVLLLVRDPRGILQSRRHRDWCPGQPDCDNPNLLCSDMVSDYNAATHLMKLYPDRFRAIRYEDLSLDPYRHVRALFKFLGLFFHRTVKEFLDSHTKRDVGGVSSTFRDSKSAPFHWKLDLNYSEVEYIEENCDQAMKLWGYVKAHNETHLREFRPITNYFIT